MSKTNSKPYVAFILAFFGVILFSSKAVMVKLAFEYNIDALSLLSLRLLFSLPFYIGVLIGVSKKETFQKFSRTDYLKIFGLGILGYYLASYLDFSGLNYVSASMERLILFVYPTIVLFLSSFLFKEKASKAQKMAVLITYFGVAMAFFKSTNLGGDNIYFGGVLIFLSAFAYSVYLVGSSKLLPKFGTKLFTSIAMIVSTTAALIHFFIIGDIDLLGFPKEVYLISFAMAVICTVLPSFLISESIRLIGATNVAIVGSFGPVSTIILAAFLLGESVNAFQILGTLIVISGVLLLSANKKPVKTNTSK